MPVVVAFRSFDLDDLGAQIGKQGRAERAGQDAGEIEDTNAIETGGIHADLRNGPGGG